MVDDEIAEAPGGRNGIVRLAKITGVAVGISLGFWHTTVIARGFHHHYEDARKRVIDVGVESGVAAWLHEVVAAVESLAMEVERHADIVTVGMAVPAKVNPRNHRLVHRPPWANGEDDLALRVRESLRTAIMKTQGPQAWCPRVVMDSDTNLGALAERTYRHQQQETLVYVMSSTHVDAGVIIGDLLIRGRRGAVANIGHHAIRADGLLCWCGRKGCLERYIGAEAVLEDVRRARGVTRRETLRSLVDVVGGANRNDPVCIGALRHAATLLGEGLAVVRDILDPNVIILAGDLAEGRELVLKHCREALERSAAPAEEGEGHELDVVWSTLPDAPAQGALLLGIRGPALDAEFSPSE
ncbi:hypothetical protein GCM10022226_64240 [Sphaerisporangium flaviroseum]|uniref:ROK family protein n=1 Tax=Sphaerisporangium flaviroseum TaxID=509199 RepID=A0ABP7J4U2_9ACTN